MSMGNSSISDNLKHGTVEMVLLCILEQEDKYGYQLMQDVKQWSDGGYQLTETTMYPTLYRLKNNGYLDERKEQVVGKRFRVYYHLSDDGKEYLDEMRREYRGICIAIDKILTYSDRYQRRKDKDNTFLDPRDG